jgi:hypothetical protein
LRRANRKEKKVSKNKQKDQFGHEIGSNRWRIAQKLTGSPQTATAICESLKREGFDYGEQVANRLKQLHKAGKIEFEEGKGYWVKGREAKKPSLTRTTDQKARVSLPLSFANSTVLIEQVSDTELRIRRAVVIPEDEIVFAEEVRSPLSDRDRDFFLSVLDNPPEPNEALKKLMRGHK